MKPMQVDPMRRLSALRLSSVGLMAGCAGVTWLALWGSTLHAGEIRAAGGSQSLGTVVNGGVACSSGACAVTGGTPAGGNLFHRFSGFDTRGAITGVSIQNTGFGAVIVGVTSPLGSFIDKPVALAQPGQLYWLSPGGIALSGGGSFPNALQLNLSTATGLRIGSNQFDVGRTTSLQAAALNGLPGTFVTEAATIGSLGLLANGDLSIDGGLLTVEKELLLDAQGGHLLVDGTRLQAPGGNIALVGRSTSLHNALVDVSAPAGPAGRVVLKSQESTLLSGTTQVRAEGDRGGAIDLLGRMVTLSDQTVVQASGERGGGSIRIGGDYLGGNREVANALQTLVGPDVQVLANATVSGDGGRVIVWADDTTRMLGTLQARGAQAGGDGGFIETSGKRVLRLGSTPPDASAPNGDPGTWLLDPGSITIESDASGSALDFLAGPNPYQNGASQPDVFIDSASIQEALTDGTNVKLIAAEDIFVNAQIFAGSLVPVTLHLEAGGSISVNQSIGSTSELPLNVLLDAARGDVSVAGPIETAGGEFAARAGGSIKISASIRTSGPTSGPDSGLTSGGLVSLQAGEFISGTQGQLNAGSGNVLLRAVRDIRFDSVFDGIVARQVAAISELGDVEFALRSAPSLAAVEVGPIQNQSFFGGRLSASGISASNGQFQVVVYSDAFSESGLGDLSFVGGASGPAVVLAGGTTQSEGSLQSSLLANRIVVKSGARLTISDVAPASSGDNEPLLLSASVVIEPGGAMIVADRGLSQVQIGTRVQSPNVARSIDQNFNADAPSFFFGPNQDGARVQVGFDANVFNQGLISVESGAALALPASFNALELASGSIVSGGGTIVGVLDPSGGTPLTRVLQRGPGGGLNGAMLSPGEGDMRDGQRSIGSLSFENLAYQSEAGAVWRFDLGSGSAGAVDSIAFPSSSTLFVTGVPELVVGLEIPSSPPPSQTFTLSPDLSVNAEDLVAMNRSLRLVDGVQGTLESGSLLFVYQGQSSGGGGGGGPVPPVPLPTPPGSDPAQVSSASRSDLSLNQLLGAIGTLEPPIIPGYDVKPRPSMLPEVYGRSLASLAVNIAESFMGELFSAGDPLASVVLSSSLDRSISLPAVSGALSPPVSPSASLGLGETSLVLSVDDSSEAMQAFRAAEIRRAADVTSNLNVEAPPVSSPEDLSLPTLRAQLDQAVKIVRASAGREAR